MSVNKVILLGNVGKEPDVRYFEANKAVANFTLATTERARKGPGEQVVPERTEWHNIVARGGLAQIVEKYVHKGSKLYVEGKIRSRTYVDRENQTRFVTEIVADELELLGRREPREATEQNGGHGSLGEPRADYGGRDSALSSDFSTPF